MNETEGTNKKMPYIKPQVKRVILKPEEAVLGACKTIAIAGPFQARCNNSGMKCSVIGS